MLRLRLYRHTYVRAMSNLSGSLREGTPQGVEQCVEERA